LHGDASIEFFVRLLSIAAAIMAPRVFKPESLPSAPTWDDVRKAIDAVAGDQPRRQSAIAPS
jgi:hypothetical protein